MSVCALVWLCMCVCVCVRLHLNRCKCVSVYESATLRYGQEKNKMNKTLKTIVQCIKLFHWNFEHFKASKRNVLCNRNKNPIETHNTTLYWQIFNLKPDCSWCNGRSCKKRHLKDSFIPPESFYRTTEQSPKSKTITVVTKEENWMNMNWHRQEQQH